MLNFETKNSFVLKDCDSDSLPVLVSICCITYNQKEYISAAIEGFLLQSVTFGVEILIHDDASTDGTQEVITKYAIDYPKLIKPILQTENQYSKGINPNKAFNFSRAQGKYIAHCEGDDFWTDPKKLQMQVDYMEEHPNVGFTFTDVDILYESSQFLKSRAFGNKPRYRNLTFLKHLTNKYYLAPPTWLVKSDLIKTINIGQVSDGSFVIALELLRSSTVHYIDRVTATYRVLPESASHSASDLKTYRYRKGVFEIQQRYCNTSVAENKIRNEVYDHGYASLIRLARAVGDTEFLFNAEEYFKKRPRRVRYFYSLLHSSKYFMLIYRFVTSSWR